MLNAISKIFFQIIKIIISLYWFVLGHVCLIFITFSCFKNKPTFLKAFIYLILLGFIIAAKYLDVEYFQGTPADGGRPARIANFKLFLKIVLGVYSITFLIFFI